MEPVRSLRDHTLRAFTSEGEYRLTIRARARHITADHLVIPTVPGEEGERQAEPEVIDPEVPGWVYAEPLEVRL